MLQPPRHVVWLITELPFLRCVDHIACSHRWWRDGEPPCVSGKLMSLLHTHRRVFSVLCGPRGLKKWGLQRDSDSRATALKRVFGTDACKTRRTLQKGVCAQPLSEYVGWGYRLVQLGCRVQAGSKKQKCACSASLSLCGESRCVGKPDRCVRVCGVDWGSPGRGGAKPDPSRPRHVTAQVVVQCVYGVVCRVRGWEERFIYI